jgi:serine/threonine-protein kinase
MIRFRLLGSIDLRDEEGREFRAVLAQPKRLALLAYLAAASPLGPHRRDTLLALFWPELDQEHARNALSKATHFLRRTLADSAIVSRGADELAIDDAAVWTDVRALGAALDAGRTDEALELYRGDLLPSFFVPDAPGFEEWLERERARLRSRAADAARLQAERHETERHLTLAVTCARRAVELSDGDERPLRRLIEMLERVGDRSGAVRAYEAFARKLASELEVKPAPETVALIERIRASLPPLPPSIVAPPHHEASLPPIAHLGTALAHRYKVERELGSGAMAVVALAHDLRHHRRVAIKILRPELTSLMGPERFLREIDISASLMHPHILPLHDSGEADGLLYYVMPYVEGESLRGRLDREPRLPVEDALQIAREVADALAYAHHRGFVHRDIKPENILLGGGHAVVADFGIARAIGSVGQEHRTAQALGTGTPAYMSPEQATGECPVDERTDIYALGCVLYEMLAGEPPFVGPTPEATIERRLRGPAPRVSVARQEVSPELDAAIAKALARAPVDRFASVAEFASTFISAPKTVRLNRTRRLLWTVPLVAAAVAAWVLLPETQRRPTSMPASDSLTSVAVLPVENLSGDSTKAYLAEGLTADLIEELFRVEGLRVAGSATVARYRGRQPDPARVARELGVGTVVTGNVREVAGRPRVALQLVNAADGFVRWSGVYDQRDPAAGAQIAQVLAESLRLRLRPQSQALAQRGTHDPVAYDLYLRGRYLLGQGSETSVRQGVRALQQAIARDSAFAAAWAALPVAYGLLSQTGELTSADAYVLERRALERAIALDSLSGPAFLERAAVWVREYDYAAADADYRRAIELTPGSALYLMFYAQFLNLIALDDSALVVMGRALTLEPISSWFVANHSFRLSEVGQLDEAIAEALRALQLDSSQWVAHHALAWAYRRQNQAGRAAQEAERALQLVGDSVGFMLGPLGYYLGLAGRRAEALSILEKLERSSSEGVGDLEMWIAYVRLGLGDRSGALDALERPGAEGFGLSYWLSVGEFEALRGDPRYEALLERVGVAEFRNRRSTRNGRSSAAGTG